MSSAVLSGASLDTGETETFAARPTRVRERLTPREAALVHYVLSEWYGEVTAGNMWQAQMAAAVAKGEDLERETERSRRPTSDTENDLVQLARRNRPLVWATDGVGGAHLVLDGQLDTMQSALCDSDPEAGHWRKAGGRRGRCSACQSLQQAQREALAESRRHGGRHTRDESLRLMWQTIYVHSGQGAVDPRRQWLQERWSNDLHLGGRGRFRRTQQVRCWRTLKLVDARSPMSLAVLHRLYGDRPPADRGVNPFDGSYGKDLARDYWLCADLVVRETVAWIHASLRVNKVKNEGETPEAFSSRTMHARVARDATLKNMARKAETLIERAVRDFRDCWEAAGQ